MRDSPAAGDFAQAHGQPERETVLVRRVAGRIRTAAHDRDSEGYVLTCRHRELFDIEAAPGL